MKEWERIEAKRRFLKVFESENLSPRQLRGKSEDIGVCLSSEDFGQLILELLNEGKIRVVKIDVSYLSQIKNGPNGILEVFFGAVR
jgi:hypothetical protein